MVNLRELAGISENERRAIYRTAFAPYIFWTDDLSRAIGLPQNQVIYSYNPLTFMLEVAERAAHVELPRPRGRQISEASLEPRKLSTVPVDDWTRPKASPIEKPLLGPIIGVRLGPRRVEDIPLIELGSTDGR
jgi:hypothetical protein